MKKNYVLLITLLLLFSSRFLSAQITETFDNEANNSTSFSEGGITFTITSQQSYFRVQGSYPGTGWNGTANDNKYIDNSNYTSSTQGVQFTVSAANGAAITLKSMWIYVSTSSLNLSPTGMLTITGKRAGATIFSVSRSNPFNPSANVNNGFTYFNLATLGGQDNSNSVIDQYVIATDAGIGYLSVDAVKFQCAPVTVTGTTQTNVSCYGGNNGTAGVTAGPSGTLGYNWEPGDPAGDGTPSVTGLTAGTWTCTVINACGNSTTSTFTITQPGAALGSTLTPVNVSCYGTANGSITVTPSGGTAPYTYLWSTGATGASITNLAPGTYSVAITDAKGCTDTNSSTITQPAAALSTTTITATAVSCYGGASGGATVTPSGGTPPYAYLWSNGSAAASITNVAAGTYNVTVTDSKGCTATNSVTVTQPAAALTATSSQTNIACYGDGATGTAGVTPSGGTSPYAYLWSNGITTATAANLATGNYSVTITDAMGCTLTKSITIIQPAAALSATIYQSSVACYNTATGSASVIAANGTSPYTYLWSNGATGASISNVASGTYSVTVTDANGCTLSKSITVTQPAAALSATTSQTGAACYGGATGSATAAGLGGTPGYTYSWSSGETTATISNKPAGTYTVTVTDAPGCTYTTDVYINQPSAPLLATATKTDAVCYSGTGTASVTVLDGTAPYTYAWSTGATTASVTGLASGSYTITVTDANGCALTRNVTINELSTPITATIATTHPLCYGQANGTATVTPAGGYGNYTYSWSPSGGTGQTATGLAAGDYTVTITDGNGCTSAQSTTIYNLAPLSAIIYTNGAICNGSATGRIQIDHTDGGTPPYTYLWSNGSTGTQLQNIAAGNYSVVITDAHGCTLTETRTVTEPATAVSATFTQTNISCNGTTDGAVYITPAGGIPPYDYQIFPSGTYLPDAPITGLAAGDYTVSVRDGYNCSATIAFTITQPDALTATVAITDSACGGWPVAGSATVTPAGGTPPYTYSWYPYSDTGATMDNLQANYPYSVTITDANNCSIQKEVIVGDAAECSIVTTWDGTAWSNGWPACAAYSGVINGNYNSAENGTVTACSLTVNSGNVVVNSGDTFTIKGQVAVLGSATLTFETNTNLVQDDDVANVGEITYKRDSSNLHYLDYTLWSSPVTGSQTLKGFSPQTADMRFYVYNTALDTYNNYQSANSVFGPNPAQQTFSQAKSYLIRMPDGLPASGTSVFQGVFHGSANNGTINFAVSTAGGAYNAVGNPYPSAINISEFISQNQDNLADGTLYFWRKTNGAAGNAYATVTMAGFVAATGAEADDNDQYFNGEGRYQWVVNPGQGFIVRATPGATNVTFNNSMRRAVTNNQFFRPGTARSQDDVSAVWLNVDGATGYFGQAAIAYISGTTLDFDYGFDGKLLNDGALSMYTIARGTNYAIQARNVFDSHDEVALGYKTNAAGTFTISIGRYTGLFATGQQVYVKDMLTGTIHNLSADGGYSFTTQAGTFNNRFTVAYEVDGALTTAANVFNGQDIIVYKKEAAITISSSNTVIKEIEVYDLHGRLLYKNNAVNAVTAQVAGLDVQEQLLIVQVITTEDFKVTKKILY